MIQASPQTRSTQLENGVRVITEHIPHIGSAGVTVLVDAGPQDEEANQSGLAHFCEHALFLGTPLRTSAELAELIDTAGGQLGAFTAPDYTCFYSHVLEDYVSYALDLMGDILVASSFPEAALEREKNVVQQEIRQYNDNPSHLALQSIKRLLWGSDPLACSVLGNVDSVGSLTRSDVIGFISKNYTPDRIIVAAAGAIEHDCVVEQAQDAFWTLRGSSPAREEEPLDLHGGVEVVPLKTSQCTFNIAIPLPEYSSPRRHELHVVNCAIGGGMSSRYYRALREKSGMAYSISSEILAYRRGGAMLIEGVTSPENLIASLHVILFELTSLAVGQNPIGEEELWKSKMQVRGQSRLSADLIPNRVARLATQIYNFGETIAANRMLEQIDAVTIENVNDIASSVLLPGLEHLSIAVVGPIDPKGSVFKDLEGLHDCYASLVKGESVSSEIP
jgi:predicted Zn-dependent peptidase